MLETILRGTSDANIAFGDLRRLLERLDFTERIRGGHHIFTRKDIEEILNLQPKQSKARRNPIQVRQVRAIIHRYRLAGEEDE